MPSLCVLGLGYIGLPTASIFATKGRRVLGVDVSASVVETINSGRIHIQEPDLDVLVRAAVQSGNLKAATQPAPADVVARMRTAASARRAWVMRWQLGSRRAPATERSRKMRAADSAR